MDDDRTPDHTRPGGTFASRWRARLRTSRTWVAGLQLAAVAAVVAGAAVYAIATPPAPRLLSIELAGSSAEIGRLTAGSADAYRTALAWDPALIAGYAVAIVLATLVARTVALRRVERTAYGLAAGGAVLAALCDLVENLLLRIVIDAPTPARDGVAVAAQAVSFAKWVLVVPAGAVAVVAVLLTLARVRRATPEARRRAVAMGAAVEVPVRQPRVHDRADEALNRPADTADDDVAQRRSAWRAASRLPVGREHATDRMGFCVSGGGIRSGTYALGALDSLRDLLVQARYLVSVSGGGYATGAMQLAMQPLPARTAPTVPTAGTSAARPGDVFAPGSAELDHTRKHGRYLADGAREWTVAVVWLLRGVLVNLLLLAALTVVTGRLIGHLFAMFPGDMLRTDTWPPAGVWWATGSSFAAAMLLAVLRIWVEPSLGRGGPGVARVAGALFGLGCVLAVVGIGLPLLASVARRPGGVPVASGGVVSLLTAWGAAIVALGRSPALLRSVTKAWSWQAKAGTRLRGAAANLLVAVAVLLVAAALLLLLGVVLAGTGHLTGRSASWPGHTREWVYTAGALATLTFFATVDQVRWSLHPFYRRRLATAFSVRRVRNGMSVRAAAYDFDREMTPLHAYAGPIGGEPGGTGAGPRDAEFPQVIFSCAAHDTDRAVSLPGRRVVPWTMSGDYVGSPMIGWAPTRALYDYSPSVLQGDLTVQAAQAISGAAIASQLGRMGRSYSHLLTLTNVRLGSWLPNPTYLRAAEPGAWMVPGLPHRRYLNTLGRELFGAHPGDAPLVYVTDGGHYENLGLVELLRHRPCLVVCIDGSGDRPDVATTFAEAIQLAYEELGVVVETGDAAQLGAGPEGPPRSASSQLLGELEDRLAQSCVLTARISYPDLGAGLPASEGLLFLGKATLTSQMPFDLLAHACRNPAFPNDSTADQWFDFAQFDAYHALGRHVGRQLRETILALADPPPVIPPQRVAPTFHLRGGDGQDLLIDLTSRAEPAPSNEPTDSKA